MSSGDLLRKVEELSDLELALLLSLVANEHCLIHSEKESLETLGQELQLVRPAISYRCNLAKVSR